jgi:septum formation protein
MAKEVKLVLASNSPRRKDLLRQIGVSFEQITSPAPEPEPEGLDPNQHVVHSARTKARAVRDLLERKGEITCPTIIVGADTVVSIDGEMLGKPADEHQSRAMLLQLSGRVHQVYTGVAVIRPDGGELADSVVTDVSMKTLSAREVRIYAASGEPLDKAGAYGIQGLAARFVERVEGCYYNVVGLPLYRLCAMLEEAGYEIP